MQIRFIRNLFFALVVLSMSAAAFAHIRVAITIGPPALPVYEQPICPGDGYLWTPGYWAWGDDFNDYYWVPGTWVEPPEVGFLWTPGYWGWGGDRFIFNAGYWGPHIGFYGGINYGFGYFGTGFAGGRWDGGHFFYNRAVTNINVTNIHNVYNTTVINNTTVNRISYNGGKGGIDARATAEEEAAAHDRHVAAVAAQTQHAEAARSNPKQRASANHGKPPIAATDRPNEFKGHGVVKAKEAGAPYTPNRGEAGAGQRDNADHPANPVHAKDLTPQRPAPPNTGDANRDKKYQQQQDKLMAQQDKERQKLQQQQDREHQKMDQKANDSQRQQLEQRHSQQTQQLQQRHVQQQQHMQERQQPMGRGEQGRR